MIAVEEASFSLPEAKIGMAEAISITAMFPKLNARDLKYFALTGRRLTASQAKDIGLVNDIVPADQLQAEVKKLIGDIRSTDQEARLIYKKIINDLFPGIKYFVHYAPSFNDVHLAKFAGNRNGK